MANPTPFGLGATAINGQVLFLPLQSVFVNASILDVSALVQLEQQYFNPPGNGQLSGAQYVFPIPGNAAVCAFKMEDSDGRVVTGVVKETEEAKEDFREAVSEGKFAGVAYEITADVFCITIGAIPPGRSVKITVSYSTDIPENESEVMNQIRFALPTFIGQRYGHAPAELSQRHSDDSAAKFNFKAEVKLTSKILAITSPSHPSNIAVQPAQRLRRGSAPLYATQVDLSVPVELDRDFVLSIQADKLDMPRCFAEIDKAKDTVALMLTLVPRFGAPDLVSQEYIFVLDRSGSMATELRIDYAKDALKHLIAGLPYQNTYFNIISFGTHYTPMWNQSVAYAQTRATAIATVNAMGANMGGTEIGTALDWAFRNRIRGVCTAVIVLTDGKVSRPELIINSVRQMVQASGQDDLFRVFSVGIGDGASEALCSGIARVGNGVCFMTTQNEDIKSRCSKILRAARAHPYGSTSNLSVDWGYDTVPRAPPLPQTHSTSSQTGRKNKPTNFFDRRINPFEDIGRFVLPPPPAILQAPTQVPNFYPGNRFTVAAILANTVVAPHEVVLHGSLPGGNPVNIPVKVAYVLADEERPPVLHTLAARRFIRELEDGDISALGISDGGDAGLHDDIVKAAVVDYGTRYSLASRFTSFVAIEDGEESEESDEVRDADGDSEWDSDDSIETKANDAQMELAVDESNDARDDLGQRQGDKLDGQRAGGGKPDGQATSMNDNKAGAQSDSQCLDATKSSMKGNSRDDTANDLEGKGNTRVDEILADTSTHVQSTPGYNATSNISHNMKEVHAGSNQEVRNLKPGPESLTTVPGSDTNHTRETPGLEVVHETLQVEEESVFEDESRPIAIEVESHSINNNALQGHEVERAVEASSYEFAPVLRAIQDVSFEGGEMEFVEGVLPSPSRGWYNIEAPQAYDTTFAPFAVERCPREYLEPEMEELPIKIVPAVAPTSRPAGLESVSPPMQSAPSQSFTPVVVVAADPVTPISDIQSGDGSFSLDGQLLRLLQKKKRSLSLATLKSSIPSTIRYTRNAESIWGTVLAVAYMLVALPENRSVWDSLWDKARDFVCQEANITPYEFNQLVRDASVQLQ